MVNKTRKLYQRLLTGQKPSDADIEKLMQRAEDFKTLKKTAGWRHVEEWISIQREGSHEAMEREVIKVNGFTLLSLFNTFIKYLFRLMENRTYTKLDTYINVTIQRGEHYAQQKRRAAEKQG